MSSLKCFVAKSATQIYSVEWRFEWCCCSLPLVLNCSWWYYWYLWQKLLFVMRGTTKFY